MVIDLTDIARLFVREEVLLIRIGCVPIFVIKTIKVPQFVYSKLPRGNTGQAKG